jgi:hypothetical protein
MSLTRIGLVRLPWKGVRALDDSPFKVLEQEQELCQIVERLEPVSKRRTVTVLGQYPVAQAVNRGDRQF